MATTIALLVNPDNRVGVLDGTNAQAAAGRPRSLMSSAGLAAIAKDLDVYVAGLDLDA